MSLTFNNLSQANDAIPLVPHGSMDYAELELLGISPENIIDFSANSNPYGAPPSVLEAVRNVPLDRYPDRDSLTLRRLLAVRLGLQLDQIGVGNGTAELIMACGAAFLENGSRVLVIGPTFGEYARSARLAGARVTEWTANPQHGFQILEDDILTQLNKHHPHLVYLCNPNNPSGRLVEVKSIKQWTVSFPETLFVIDESYAAFTDNFTSALSINADNLLVLHSMTKDYALAGLRLGYTAGPAPLVAAIQNRLPAWNVNALAQAAGAAALTDLQHPLTFPKIKKSCRQLIKDLQSLGLQANLSAVHFFLVEVGDGAAYRAVLLRQGILVRDCASFGLPTYIRIATRRPEQNALLINTIKKVSPKLTLQVG